MIIAILIMLMIETIKNNTTKSKGNSSYSNSNGDSTGNR